MPKRNVRGNAKDRKCSADLSDSGASPPKKSKYNLRKYSKEDGTIWIDDDTLKDEKPKVLIIEQEESSEEDEEETEEEEEEEDDEDYDEEEEEDEEEDIKYILKRGGFKVDNKFNLFEEIAKSLNKKKNSPKVPMQLTTIEEEYFKKQSTTEKGELLDLMKRISSIDLDQGDIPHKFKVLKMPIPDYTKSIIIKKLDALAEMTDNGESYKLKNWIEAFLRIPFGTVVPLPVRLLDGQEKCTEFMVNARKEMDATIYGMNPAKTQIMQIIAQLVVNPASVGNVIALQGPMGVGKCHAKDTPILMYDGSIKLVQDIVVNDVIMGDNSTPRKVLNLGRGRDIMYDVIPVKGEKYTVNSEHILCLKQSGVGCIIPINRVDGIVTFKSMRFDNQLKTLKYKTFMSYEQAHSYLESFNEEDNITEISVKDYLNLPKVVKDNWLKGYRKGVEFSSKPLDFDPYIIGLWLGDGSSSGPKITSQDAVILGYLNTNLRKYDLMLNYISQYDYYIRSYKKNENTFLKVLQNNNLINNKHIPDIYKINDRQTRLKVLAGLIDTDGYMGNNCFEISQKSKTLADDIIFLCRSLGFACYCNLREKYCMYKGEKKTGLYYIISISGNISEVPVLINRKKPGERTQIKDHLVHGFNVKCVGEGDYYGFTLDGNNRYLMGDFTVTHNTSFARNAIAQVLKRPFEFFSLGGSSDVSTFVGHSYTYEGSIWGRIADSLMRSKVMNPVIYFDELDKVSGTPHGEEIIGMMIHMTDRAQNSQFHDRYFSGIDFDLSQCIFVFSFNDIDKVHPILRDRMTVINCEGYSEVDKKVILKDFIWKQLLKTLMFDEKDILLKDDAIEYIISEYSKKEKGVRTLIRTVETMMTRLNMLRVAKHPSMKEYKFYMEFDFPLSITEPVVKKLLGDLDKKDIESWKTMYT